MQKKQRWACIHGHACTGDRKNSTENRNSKNCLVRVDFLKIFQFSCALLCNMMHVCHPELKHAKQGGKGVPLSIFIMMIMTYTDLIQLFRIFCKPNLVMFHIMNLINSKIKHFQFEIRKNSSGKNYFLFFSEKLSRR